MYVSQAATSPERERERAELSWPVQGLILQTDPPTENTRDPLTQFPCSPTPSLPSSVSCQVVVSGPLWPSVAQCGPGCKLLLTAMNDFIFMNGRAAVGSNTPLVCHNLPVPHEVVKFSSCLTADSK